MEIYLYLKSRSHSLSLHEFIELADRLRCPPGRNAILDKRDTCFEPSKELTVCTFVRQRFPTLAEEGVRP